MDADEIEISEEDLHQWIREEVQRRRLVSPDTLEKCKTLQSHLEKREKQATCLLKLCESVAACERIVRKLYSLLGWEYRDRDSDDDRSNITEGGSSSGSTCDCAQSRNQDKHPAATSEPAVMLPKLQNNENMNGNKVESSSVFRKGKPVVVLTRLPRSTLNALLPSAPKKRCMDEDTHDKPTDELCESRDSSSRKNKRKHVKKRRKPARRRARPQENPEAKSNGTKTSESQSDFASDSNASKMCTGGKTPESKADRKETAKSSGPAKNPTKVNEAMKKPSPSQQQVKLCVDMFVLARRRELTWQRGQIKEIQTKVGGRVNYKVSFEPKGKSVVSGHHIATDCKADAGSLFVGARVVIKCPEDKRYCPGILAEMPCRRNHMRFLVFTDDHTPVYVGLPLLHLVYSPLPDPLDDIFNITHRDFMKDYLEKWPYQPQIMYKVGEMLNAELNGVLERCKVQVVDCSIIQVIFESNQRKEWIYRGSIRLEYRMKEKLDGRKNLRSLNKMVSH